MKITRYLYVVLCLAIASCGKNITIKPTGTDTTQKTPPVKTPPGTGTGTGTGTTGNITGGPGVYVVGYEINANGYLVA